MTVCLSTCVSVIRSVSISAFVLLGSSSSVSVVGITTVTSIVFIASTFDPLFCIGQNSDRICMVWQLC